jgi:hypothetical protein
MQVFIEVQILPLICYVRKSRTVIKIREFIIYKRLLLYIWTNTFRLKKYIANAKPFDAI